MAAEAPPAGVVDEEEACTVNIQDLPTWINSEQTVARKPGVT